MYARGYSAWTCKHYDSHRQAGWCLQNFASAFFLCVGALTCSDAASDTVTALPFPSCGQVVNVLSLRAIGNELEFYCPWNRLKFLEYFLSALSLSTR